MRNLLLLLILIFLKFDVNAQSCTSFYLLQKNKTATFAVYNKRGDANGTIIYKISDVIVKGNNVTAAVHTNLFDKKKKSLNNGLSHVKCGNGILMMDMKLFLPLQQTEQFDLTNAKAKNAFLEYPADMNTGDHLKDGFFSMEIDNNGVKQILNMQIRNRKALGMEQINTKAGTWNCVVITYQVKLNIQTGPIAIPLNFDTTEWFAPGFGIVKMMSEAGATEIVSLN